MPSVYVLCDPTTLAPRYVGKANRPEIRLKEHLKDAESGDTHKCHWLRKLGSSPVLKILATLTTQAEANLAEIRWMNLLRQWGARLTNGREGGHGGLPGLEARRKISLTLKGRSSPNKGNVYSPEQRAKCAQFGESNPFFGKHHSERSKALIRLARATQVCSPDTRRKLSLALRGNSNRSRKAA